MVRLLNNISADSNLYGKTSNVKAFSGRTLSDCKVAGDSIEPK